MTAEPPPETAPTAEKGLRRGHLRFKVIDWTHGLRCRGVVLHASDGILCLLCGKEWSCPCCDVPPRAPHAMHSHGRVAMHSPSCWCREQRGPNDRRWVYEHDQECAECRETTRVFPPGEGKP